MPKVAVFDQSFDQNVDDLIGYFQSNDSTAPQKLFPGTDTGGSSKRDWFGDAWNWCKQKAKEAADAAAAAAQRAWQEAQRLAQEAAEAARRGN